MKSPSFSDAISSAKLSPAEKVIKISETKFPKFNSFSKLFLYQGILNGEVSLYH